MAFEKDNIIAQLKDASITDLNDLVKAIEEEFDVSASAPVAAAGAAGDAAAKSTFDVELTSAGAGKIKVIKELKGITGLGLKECKEIVDSAPSMVKEGLSEDEANDIKEKLEAQGATVTLK